MAMDVCDLIVIGGGPAALAAAREAARAGLDVVMLHEAALSYSRRGLRVRGLRQVWSVGPGFRADALGPDGPEALTAPRLIAVHAPDDRVVPFPGCTLPGVAGLGAEAGWRVVLAGCGPALVAAALRLGPAVLAVADLASPAEWLRDGQAAAFARLRRRGVLVLPRHTVMQAAGDGAVRRVQLGPVDRYGRPAHGAPRWIDTDALLVGHGPGALADITRLLRAAQRFGPACAGWVPVTDPYGRTSVPGLFAVAARDGAVAGRLAGQAAASDAGRTALAPDLRRQRRRATPRPPGRFYPGLLATIPPDTVICPCEGIARRDIDAAVAAGASEINQLKQFTRLGMGECQGRHCLDVAAALLAAPSGAVPGCATIRPPLRPVPLAALLGRFDYADIPVPSHAPL